MKWLVGQEVKTPPSHGGNTGSSPVRAGTNLVRKELLHTRQSKGNQKGNQSIRKKIGEW